MLLQTCYTKCNTGTTCWQGYIAHATASPADKPTTQKMLASTLQITA